MRARYGRAHAKKQQQPRPSNPGRVACCRDFRTPTCGCGCSPAGVASMIETLSNGSAESRIQALLVGVKSPEPLVRLEALRACRVMLTATKNPPVKEVGQSEIFQLIVESLKLDAEPDLQVEATLALTAFIAQKQELALLKSGVVPPLLRFSRDKQSKVREQAMWILGNMVSNNQQCRDYLVVQGFIDSLLEIANEENERITVHVSRLIVGFLSKTDEITKEFLVKLVPVLVALFNKVHRLAPVLVNITLGLSSLKEKDLGVVIANSTIVPNLVQFLDNHDQRVIRNILKIVMTATSNVQRNNVTMIMETRILDFIPTLLDSSIEQIKGRALWILNNITFANEANIDAIIKRSIVPKLACFLSNEDDRIRRVAICTIVNILYYPKHLAHIEQLKLFAILTENVYRPLNDLVIIALEAIRLMIAKSRPERAVQLISYLKLTKTDLFIAKLQNHERKEIAELALIFQQSIFNHPQPQQRPRSPNTLAEKSK